MTLADERRRQSVTDLVEQPAKVMRIGTMIKQLLEEVRAAPLDDASRNRLREIHKHVDPRTRGRPGPGTARGTRAAGAAVQRGRRCPSDAELRIAQAQLVGWLEGLFHGIQTALFAQQMAARAQLEQMRQGALPPGVGGPDTRGPALSRAPGSTCSRHAVTSPTRTSRPATPGSSSRSSTPSRAR